MELVVKYTIFSLLATIMNIASQDISLRVYSGLHSVVISVLIGTAIGLVVKYILDKKYIFRYSVKNAFHDSQKFAIYTSMGLITTLIFWGFEFSFDYIFQSKEMRYLGGVIGLTIGYYIKYQLDKRYVFSS